MKFRKKPLLSALAVSAGFFLFGSLWLARHLGRIEKLQEPVSAVVARRDLEAGVLLDESHVALRDIPRRFLQPGGFILLEDVLGQVSLLPFRKGEQILSTKVIPLGGVSGLAPRIVKGLRGVTLPLESQSAMANLIRPNDFVDVLATLDFEGVDGNPQSQTMILAERVPVLAVEGDYGGPKEAAGPEAEKGGWNFAGPAERSLTLGLSPEAAQKILFAADNAVLHFILRSPDDRGAAGLKGIRAGDLLGIPAVLQKGRFREIRGLE